MTEPKIRVATLDDFPAILALNKEFEHFLSPMDARRLDHLDSQSAYHRVIRQDGQVLGFLLAFREGADYDSPNYRWFADRYKRFVYVDRVVVTSKVQAKGLGTALYKDLFAYARENGIPLVTCEFDQEPPNPSSERFHAAMGFREVGTQVIRDGKKTVTLQLAEL